MTERLHFHFSLPCIGEGNGNSLQCTCLENPRDRGAWWAAVYGAAQSRTRLKWLSSSSSSSLLNYRAIATEIKTRVFWSNSMPWRREWQPTPEFLPGEFHGQRSLVGYSSWGLKESDMTKWLTFSSLLLFSLSRSSMKLSQTNNFPFSFFLAFHVISKISFYILL